MAWVEGFDSLCANLDNGLGLDRFWFVRATPDCVVPVLVTGIYGAAYSDGARTHGFATIAGARRRGKWAPVTPVFAGAGMHRGDA